MDNYHSEKYNVNYIATQSDKERKSFFPSPSKAHDGSKMKELTGTQEEILWKLIQCKVRQLKAVASLET